MKKKESIFDKGKRTIPITFGIVIILFVLLLYLSSLAPHFRGLGYFLGLTFGFIGFNFLMPMCIYFAIRLIWNIKKKENFARHVVGFFIMCLGLGLLLVDIGFNGNESIARPDLFFDELKSGLSNNLGFAFNIKLGFGILSYLFIGIVASILGSLAAKIISIVILAIGVLVTCANLIENTNKYVTSLIVNYKNKKSLKEKLKREEEEGIDLSEISTELLNEKLKNESNNDENNESEKPSNNHSRYERNLNNQLNSNSSLPERRFYTSPTKNSGLTVALFEPDSNEDTSNVINEDKQLVSQIDSIVPAEEDPFLTPLNNVHPDTVPDNSKDIVSNNMLPEYEIEKPLDKSSAEDDGSSIDSLNNENINQSDELSSSDCENQTINLPYEYPSSDLLNPVIPQDNSEIVEKACLVNEEKINAKLESLGVGAYVVSHTIGPSVTRYDIKMHEDVPVSNVSRIINDLSIKLGGTRLRFETLVEGSETSGLEVANPVTTTVYFKECFDSLPKGPLNNLVIPFGKSIDGKFVNSDLSQFPHMLVSGTTGSGKSIFLHQLLLTLIMKNSSKELKLLLIDPKHIELGKYRELPHLLCPVVSEPYRAKIALEKVVAEMDRRYTVLDEAGGLDFREYNSEYAPIHGLDPLPFIIITIDEFGDLIDSCKNISELVLKLAAKARAAGIHMIIATQRPDVSVISGTIKANLNVKVALSMSYPQDSVTILGQAGAEKLNGKGDMLIDCQNINRSSLVRCQGSLVSKDEIRRVADFIRERNKTEYNPEFLDLEDHSNDFASIPTLNNPSFAEQKELNDENTYQMVKETMMARDYASASGIQREFGFGYPRAAKFLDRLVKEGIAAQDGDPRNTSRGRYVLIHIESKPTSPVGGLQETKLHFDTSSSDNDDIN